MPVNYFDDKDKTFSVSETFVDTMIEDSKLGDNLYMFPRDYDQIVMYYNRDLLSLAGISESRIPSDRALTSEEFNTLLADIRNAFKDMSGTNPNNSRAYSLVRSLDASFAWGSLCWPTLKSFGGNIVDADGNVVFNSEANIKAATYVRELIENEYLFNGTTQYSQFVNQLSVLCFNTRAVLTELIKSTDSAPGVAPQNLGVAPMPMLDSADNYSIGAGCSGYGMYRYAENPTAAWLFLKFVASEKGQNAFCSTGNGVPSNKTMLYDENATWRNISGGDFDKLVNFNHDAYIYAWDTAACTLQDFKKNISVTKAREAVSEKMTDTMKSCLSTKSASYIEDIKTLFKRGDATIYSTIEGYKDD
jgi:multiple sugar transport system substrate-binding protein